MARIKETLEKRLIELQGHLTYEMESGRDSGQYATCNAALIAKIEILKWALKLLEKDITEYKSFYDAYYK